MPWRNGGISNEKRNNGGSEISNENEKYRKRKYRNENNRRNGGVNEIGNRRQAKA
jgi:hypothetical protein